MIIEFPSWSNWNSWSECNNTVKCGVGHRTRNQTCTVPEAECLANGANDGCETAVFEVFWKTNFTTEECKEDCTVVNGTWSSWTDWTDCSVKCGGNGQSTQNRTCNNPAPANGGLECLFSNGSSSGLFEDASSECYYYCPCKYICVEMLLQVLHPSQLYFLVLVISWFNQSDF